jgi:hypothetical protein
MRYSVDQGILISITALAKKIPERMEIAKGYWQRALKTDSETQQLVQKLTKGLGRLKAPCVSNTQDGVFKKKELDARYLEYT